MRLAPAPSSPSHGWKREAEELRALLAVVREQLDALLATHAASSTAAAPASAENLETGDARGEMDVEDPEAEPATSRCTVCSGTGKWFGNRCGKCGGAGLVPPAASEAPLPPTVASAEPLGGLEPALGAAGPANGPAGAQLEHAGGVPANRPTDPRSRLLQPGLGEDAVASWPAAAVPPESRSAIFARLRAESVRHAEGRMALLALASAAALEAERTLVAGSVATGRDLAEEVRRLQRERPDARAQWVTYCGEQFGGVKDPLKHTVASLRRFLSMV